MDTREADGSGGLDEGRACSRRGKRGGQLVYAARVLVRSSSVRAVAVAEQRSLFGLVGSEVRRPECLAVHRDLFSWSLGWLSRDRSYGSKSLVNTVLAWFPRVLGRWSVGQCGLHSVLNTV